jgi:methylphosphotriester-DNA--protein-cysteine methyltransferase
VPGPDGSGPEGWEVKGNADSGLYHTPSSPSWKRMRAEAWFESEEAAEAAGFRRWDWRRTAS